MQYRVKQWFAVLLALMMAFTALSATALAESVTPTETAPSVGVPFGEGMLAFDSEEAALAYLWSLEDDEYGIMPIGEIPGTVAPEYFRFSIYGANESGTPKTYESVAELTEASFTVTPAEEWSGPNGGDLLKDGETVEATLNTYPQTDGYRISSIRLNGTIIYHLGMYEVGDGDQKKEYVHFTSIDAQGRLTTVVLTKSADQYDNPPFEVRYVPNEYEITYEVYLNGIKQNEADETFGLNKIFGENRATETVDDWASVDVTIPAGYTGRVYIGDSASIQSEDTYEKFPNESSYGNYPLGAEPEYDYQSGTNTIDIVTDDDTPGSYTLTGTYSVGSSTDGVKENQTVRVVLTKKTSITFHAEAWQNYVIGGTSTENKVNVTGSWTVTQNLDDPDEGATLSWTFDMKASYQDGNSPPSTITGAELRTLEINGATITVPFVSAAATEATKETTLPSGATVTIAAEYNGGNPRYTITVTDATRDIWITGGSMNTNADTYKELIISGLYGVNVELWANNSGDGEWIQVAAGDTFCTGYDWGRYEEQTAYDDAGFLYHLTGGSEPNVGNVRFQLQDGFTFADGELGGSATNPTVQLVDKTGVVQSSSGGVASVTALTVSGPDSERWYYVTLPSPYGDTNASARAETMNAYLLEVHAYPEQYVVVYQDGVSDDTGTTLNPGISGTVSDMPDYTPYGNRYVDNNSNQYYAIAAGDGSYTGGDASDSITVSNTSPTITQDDPDARAVGFQGWVLTDADGSPYKWTDSDDDGNITIADKVKTPKETTSNSSEYPVIQPSDLLELRNIMDASTDGFGTTGTEYALYLTALWSEPAPRYTYYVTFNYTDETGTEHTHVQATVTRAEEAGSGSTTEYEAHLFEDSEDEYYIVKRETFFNLDGLFEFLGVTGLSVAFDPDNVSSISGGDLGDNWKWYKYDTRTGDDQKNGSEGDIYKWTGVGDDGEVDVWFISTLGQLTVGKTVTDPFPDATDPADAVRATAVFTFDVEFTLPEDDPGTTMGDESNYFVDTGGSYSVQYTVSSSGAPADTRTLTLLKSSSGTYTGTLTLKDGQKAAFTLPDGTYYTVTEQKYKPTEEGGVDFKLTKIDNKDESITDASVLISGATGSITAATDATEVQFTNAPTTGGLTVAKTVQGSKGDTTKEWNFRVELESELSGTYGGMSFTGGVAEFTLRHGESKTAIDLPPGTAYTVTEEEANQDGYTTTATGDSGTIPDGGTAQAAFTNTIGETPTGNEFGDIPKTGDESHPARWFFLMILSLIGITVTVLTSIIGRKKTVSANGKHMRK